MGLLKRGIEKKVQKKLIFFLEVRKKVLPLHSRTDGLGEWGESFGGHKKNFDNNLELRKSCFTFAIPKEGEVNKVLRKRVQVSKKNL